MLAFRACLSVNWPQLSKFRGQRTQHSLTMPPTTKLSIACESETAISGRMVFLWPLPETNIRESISPVCSKMTRLGLQQNRPLFTG